MEDVYLEEFDTSSIDAHIGLSSAAFGIAGLLVVALLVTLVVRRVVRMSFILIILVWCAQTLVGFLVWQLTYTTMRNTLTKQVETMLLSRTISVSLSVVKSMDTGPGINSASANLIRNNWLSLNGTFREAVNMTQSFAEAHKGNNGIAYVYYGNRHGSAYGYSALENHIVVATTDTELLRHPNESMFSEDIKCMGADDDDNCTQAMCPLSSHRCGMTCNIPTRYGCIAGPATGLLIYLATPDWTNFTDARIIKYPFNFTERPWYIEGIAAGDRNSWTEPYVFSHGGTIGISVVRGVREPSDPSTFLGVLSVDFTISSLDSMMRAGVPTQNSFVLMLSMKGAILAGSLPRSSLVKQIPDTPDGVAQFDMLFAHESSDARVRDVVSVLMQRFGSYHNTLERAEAMLLHEGRRMISVRRAVMEGGLETLVVIVIPYYDVLHDGEAASTEALALAVVISVLSSLLIGGLVMVLMRPLHTLIGAVHDVAHMRLEGMESLDLRGSYLREVRIMSEAMRVLMQNMREYKPFLPEVIFNDNLESTTYVDREPPGVTEGRAAVVFTDIVGSTRLWERSYDGMLKALQQHNEVIRDAIREVNGYEVKTIGDSFMVAFDTAEEGLRFGLRVQEGMAGQEWPESILDVSPDGVVVRIGVNFGTVAVEHNELVGRFDYLGPAVNRAARLEGCCRPSTVAVQSDIIGETSAEFRSEVVLKHVEDMTLRGVVGPVSVTMVVPIRLRHLVLSNPLVSDTASSVSSTSSVRTSKMNTPDASDLNRSRRQDLLKFSETLEVVYSATIGHIENIMNPTSDGLVKEEVTSTVNLGLIRIVTYLEITGGKSLTVAGSAGIVGWNATKQCASHVESAFRFVGLLTKSSHDKVHCGLSSGKILTGYVGTRGQRYITAVGPAMRQCIHLSCQAELIGTTALYASEERTATLVLSSRGYIRPVHEATVSGQHVLMFEMHIQRLNQWCHNKLVSLFGDVSQTQTQTQTPDPSWSREYYEAYQSRNYQQLMAFASEEPALVSVIARLKASPAMLTNASESMPQTFVAELVKGTSQDNPAES